MGFRSFERGWRGVFKNDHYELAYRMRVWSASQSARRFGIVFFTLAWVMHVTTVVRDLSKHPHGSDHWVEQVPILAVTTVGLGCLWLGWAPRPWIVWWWDVLASCGLACLISPMIVVCVAGVDAGARGRLLRRVTRGCVPVVL